MQIFNRTSKFPTLTNLVVIATAPLLFSSALSAEPVSYEIVYTGEFWSNQRGGIKKGNAYIDNLDFTLTLDADEAWGWSGVSAFAYILHNNSETLTGPLVGDIQGISNIDNTAMLGVMELWVDKTWSSSQSLRFGLYDLNSEFDAIDTAGFFINPSHGIGPDYSQSGSNGPSIFPVSSLALRFQGVLSEHSTYRFAVLDAVPGDPDDDNHGGIKLSSEEGVLLAAEVDRQFTNSRAALGAWYYNKKTDQLSESAQHNNALRNNSGIYGFIDHAFSNTEWLPGQLNGFLRVGFSDSHINQLHRYVGTGLVLSSFNAARPDDVIGFAIASARNGTDFKQQSRLDGFNPDSQETNYELSYRAPLGDFVTAQADIQYVVNPGTDPVLNNALLFGLRLEFLLN